MDDKNRLVGVGVRVGIKKGRRPMGGPAGVPNRQMIRLLVLANRFGQAGNAADLLGQGGAVGPDLMLSAIKHLSHHSDRLISVLPNAGLPEKRGDDTYFPLQPAQLAEWLDRFVPYVGVSIVGGCCGPTAGPTKRGWRVWTDPRASKPPG